MQKTDDVSFAEAQAQARVIETDIFEHAPSREAYEAACNAIGVPESDIDGEDESEEEEEADTTDVSLVPAAVTIGRYLQATHYRDGLFSLVFKAKQPSDPEETPGRVDFVALKVTNPSMMHPPHNSEREARILDVCRSPNVVELRDTFQQAGGRFVLVFPFLKYDLETILQKRRMTKSTAKTHLRDLLSALKFIHAKGIIHRDVKPSNLLLSSIHGPVCLADFGIAWSPDDVASEPVHNKITDVGTTCYRPPELLFGNTSYNCSLDMWAAGCVAAELVMNNGKTLFDAGDLGSEFALIKSIHESLGTPTLREWPVRATLLLTLHADICRKLLIFAIGARCCSRNAPRNRGRSSFQALQRRSKTL